MKVEYIPPKYWADAFNCPHCRAYAHQEWSSGGKYNAGYTDLKNLSISTCSRCNNYSLWINEKIVYPNLSTAPFPFEDMPTDVKNDFLEAREIINQSPRAAAALLRLALQKLMPHLEEEGKNLNTDIGNLVKKGLSPRIQKALDSVRVIGNEAVHPGQMDLDDDLNTSIKLFKLMNIITDEMITKPKEIDEIFGEIPENKKEGIINRDKAK